MPHYKDGMEAKVGDLVKGVTYNRNGKVIVGTVLEVVPGSESCNVRVAFVDAKLLPADPPGHQWHDLSKHPTWRTDHGTYALVAEGDYGETRAFELLHRQK